MICNPADDGRKYCEKGIVAAAVEIMIEDRPNELTDKISKINLLQAQNSRLTSL